MILTHLACKGFINFVYINVIQSQTYGPEKPGVKRRYFCLMTTSKRVIAWQPPSMNSSSTPDKKEEPQLHVGHLHLNKFMYSSV